MDMTQWPWSRPLVKWTGGKGSELSAIGTALPAGIRRHIEPFVGGGAVMFAMPPTITAAVNDRSADLIALYRAAADNDVALSDALRAIDAAWAAVGAIPTSQPDATMTTAVAAACGELDTAIATGVAAQSAVIAARAIARRRIFLATRGTTDVAPGPLLEAALKGGLYTALRSAFNAAAPGARRAAMFWFLRDFCYGGMFRTNASGGFNVPYGGISYNTRSMAPRLAQIAEPNTASRLAATRFTCGDFETFLVQEAPDAEDFIFLDPPYDSPFSAYDGNTFAHDDHRRLARWMAKTPARWMLVIAETPFVRECYGTIPGARVSSFGKTYQGCIKGRYERQAVHLVVTNYDWAAKSDVDMGAVAR